MVSAFEDGLCSLYRHHIDPAPKESQESLDAWIMLAVRDGPSFRLFHNDRSVLAEVDHVNYSGIGVYVGYTMLDLLLPKHSTVELVSQIVAYTLAISKEWVPGVGKGSNVHMLHNDGTWDSLIVPERKEIESAFSDLMKELPELVRCCEAYIHENLYDSQVEGRLQSIKQKMSRIRELRGARVKRREERAKRLAAL